MEYDWESGDLIMAGDREIARADRSWFRERADVQIGPDLWTFRTDGGFFSQSLLAELNGEERLRASPGGMWAKVWTVSTMAGAIELKTKGLLGTKISVLRDGQEIGEVSTSGFFTNRPSLIIDFDLPDVEAVFILWVAYVEFNRASDGGT